MTTNTFPNQAQWEALDRLGAQYHAEQARRGFRDPAAIEFEKLAGLFAPNTESLPPTLRVVADLLACDLRLQGVAFVDHRANPIGFTAAFSLAARSGIRLFARGPWVCLTMPSAADRAIPCARRLGDVGYRPGPDPSRRSRLRPVTRARKVCAATVIRDASAG